MATTERQTLVNGIGRLTLLVEDLDTAVRWYRTVLGFEVLHDSTVEGFRYLHIGVPGQPVVGLWLLPTGDTERVGAQTAGEPLLVLYTDDLDAVIERLVSHDVEHWDVRDDGSSRSLHLRDVVGNVLVVAQLRPER